MIAITGASGNLGKATLSNLLRRTASRNIVAIVRDPQKISDFAKEGISVRQADYNDLRSMSEALNGVETLLQISSSANGPEAALQEANVVQAARQAGIRHLIYTSTLTPEPGAHFLAAHTCHSTEKMIQDSGIAYTFFRNSMYHETIPLFTGSALEDGQVHYPTDKGKVSFVSRLDIGEAIAILLTNPPAQNQVLNITGPQALSFADIATLLHETLSLPAAFHFMPMDMYKSVLLEAGLPEEEALFYVSMAKSIDAGEFALTDNALANILGREPLSVKSYLAGMAELN